jgi:hypothetical protein
MEKSHVFAPAARLAGVTTTVTPFAVSFFVASCAAALNASKAATTSHRNRVNLGSFRYA